MTASKEMAAKAKKIAAYKELLKMAKASSGRVDLELILSMERREQKPHLVNDQRTRESYLNELLCDLVDRHRVSGAAVKNGKEIEEESRVIQLALTAGANPNCHYPYGIYPSCAIFDAFIRKDKYHGALLVAQNPGFVGPENQRVLELLDSYLHDAYKLEFPGKKEMPYARELVYVLFSKGMKPYNPKIRKSLQPIYEEEKKARATAQKIATNAPKGGRVGAGR